MTLVIAFARLVDLTSLNLETIYGSFFTASVGFGTWVLGLAIHLVVSGLVAQVYSFGFQLFDRFGPSVGASFGFIHWLLAGIGLGIFTNAHPAIPNLIIPPGYFAMNLGGASMLVFLLAHLGYGALVGLIHPPSTRDRMKLLDEDAALEGAA